MILDEAMVKYGGLSRCGKLLIDKIQSCQSAVTILIVMPNATFFHSESGNSALNFKSQCSIVATQSQEIALDELHWQVQQVFLGLCQGAKKKIQVQIFKATYACFSCRYTFQYKSNQTMVGEMGSCFMNCKEPFDFSKHNRYSLPSSRFLARNAQR